MRKYTVYAYVTVSCFTEVEADTPEEARRIAEDRPAEWSDWGQGADEAFIVTEIDGEPKIDEVSED